MDQSPAESSFGMEVDLDEVVYKIETDDMDLQDEETMVMPDLDIVENDISTAVHQANQTNASTAVDAEVQTTPPPTKPSVKEAEVQANLQAESKDAEAQASVQAKDAQTMTMLTSTVMEGLRFKSKQDCSSQTDAGTGVSTEDSEVQIVAMRKRSKDAATQTERDILEERRDSTVALFTALTNENILAILKPEDRQKFAKLMLGEEEASTSRAHQSWMERPTMLVEPVQPRIYECLGIKGVGAPTGCGMIFATWTAFLAHRKQLHNYTPNDEDWLKTRKTLRSHDKFQCMKAAVFTKKECKKEFYSQELLLNHVVECLHYNEVKILGFYCVTCNTSFTNAVATLKHSLRNLDLCNLSPFDD